MAGERGYKNLNTSVLRQISKVLEQDSEADIESVLHKFSASYAALRRAVHERQVKRTAVQDTLKLREEHESELSSAIVRRVLSGTVIWAQRSRAVIQVGENVAVKVTDDLNHDEYDVLQYLEQHIPSIPAPRPLGLINIGPISLMFMTIIPGDTLETRWQSLSVEAKGRIRRILDDHLATLRRLSLPPGSTFGTPSGRHLCKDVRRDERLSASSIYSESQFNDFLLDAPGSRAAPSYKHWLRSMLRTDHRILFTHADFHPRNIMVVIEADGTVELSGILDWEASGFYPEYWEQLKSLNTRSVKDTSDWWDYLPPSILGYDQEVMLDRVIETTVVY
ncbi:hypothetical protein GSI_09443 [Ganoderma sinense ZZ0214-1]|uniref:Aminoglycoside phosphotransferase domain-containing protein n=1 Tax=Ganoderma sinense ZZ0214-1 TaxID=1077348 RepID=A0A2G8S6K4_9APHY|nr:hypothetical protein GSI_09443 [Ganoderma sinense ZZ0214-1]